MSKDRGPLQRRSNNRWSNPLRRSTPNLPWVNERITAARERLLDVPLRGSCRRSGKFLLSELLRLQLFGDLRSTPFQPDVLILAFMSKTVRLNLRFEPADNSVSMPCLIVADNITERTLCVNKILKIRD